MSDVVGTNDLRNCHNGIGHLLLMSDVYIDKNILYSNYNNSCQTVKEKPPELSAQWWIMLLSLTSVQSARPLLPSPHPWLMDTLDVYNVQSII